MLMASLRDKIVFLKFTGLQDVKSFWAALAPNMTSELALFYISIIQYFCRNVT